MWIYSHHSSNGYLRSGSIFQVTGALFHWFVNGCFVSSTRNDIFGINYWRNLVSLVILIYGNMFEFRAETGFWQVTKGNFCEIAVSFICISSRWWFGDLFPASLKKKAKSIRDFRFLSMGSLSWFRRGTQILESTALSLSLREL